MKKYEALPSKKNICKTIFDNWLKRNRIPRIKQGFAF